MSRAEELLYARDFFGLLHSLEILDSKRTLLSQTVQEFLEPLVRAKRLRDLRCVLHLFDNSLAASYEGVELGIGEALLFRAIASYMTFRGRSIDAKAVKEGVKALGDAGAFVEVMREGAERNLSNFDTPLVHLFEQIKEIARIEGRGSQEEKVGAIVHVLRRVETMDYGLRFVVRILQGKLRTGVTIKTVVQCLATAVCTSLGLADKALAKRIVEECSKANDFELILRLARQGDARSLREALESTAIRVGIPMQPMLSKPTSSAQEVLERLDGKKFVCEFKYDGERAQVHWRGSDKTLWVFSRNGENTTAKYGFLSGQVEKALKDPSVDVILDGEMVAVQQNEDGSRSILPFQSLTTLSKKGASQSVHVMFVAFDILLYGVSLVERTLSERHICLESVVQQNSGQVERAQGAVVDSADEMMDLLNAAVETGCEGLMIKDGASLYEPAKRSSHWLKLKKDYLEGLGDTFDLVVMGAWLGRGKRAGMFGAYLLGTYNADTGGYETVARVGTGLSDEVLAEWWTRLNREGLVRQTKPASIDAAASLRPDVWIEPQYVWEIKAADLTSSPVHTACRHFNGQGISLRFPRLVRVREDKRAFDATTPRQMYQMYLEQPSVAKLGSKRPRGK